MPSTAAVMPAFLAALAQTLNPCPGCGALVAACLERLTGPWRDVCCDGCTHHPELPHAAPSCTHTADVCAAWAAEHGNPRGVACATHWEPNAYAEERRRRVAGLPRLMEPSLLDQAEALLPDAVWEREHGRPLHR